MSMLRVAVPLTDTSVRPKLAVKPVIEPVAAALISNSGAPTV
jgi:hypothetical protein